MPSFKRHKTKHPGVYFIEGTSVANSKPERIYYIQYRKNGKLIEEKAGRQFQDDMTPAKANSIRGYKINGNQLSNRENRFNEKEKLLEINNRWTFNRLWEEYKNNKPELKGLRTDEYRFKSHIMPFIGEKEPNQVVPFDIDKIRVILLKKLKPQTVKLVLALIMRLSNFGKVKQICDGINFKIVMPKVNNMKTEDISSEQLSRLLEVLENEPNKMAANLMKLALFTGMRRSELFRLKWEDIDFQRGFIHIRNPKGGKDQIIPLNDVARTVLEKHSKTASPFVFPGLAGKQRSEIKKPINRIKELAGLPSDFRPLHGLRHTFASMLASSGQVDIYTLQKLLTHKSPLMTQRYAHLRDEVLIRASNLTSEIINTAFEKSIKKPSKK